MASWNGLRERVEESENLDILQKTTKPEMETTVVENGSLKHKEKELDDNSIVVVANERLVEILNQKQKPIECEDKALSGVGNSLKVSENTGEKFGEDKIFCVDTEKQNEEVLKSSVEKTSEARKDEKTVSDMEANKKTAEALKDEKTVDDVEDNKKTAEARKDEKTVNDLEVSKKTSEAKTVDDVEASNKASEAKKDEKTVSDVDANKTSEARKDEKTVHDFEVSKKTSEAKTVDDVEANKKASEAKKDDKTVNDLEASKKTSEAKTVDDVEANKKASEAKKDDETVNDFEASKKTSDAKKDEKTVSDVEASKKTSDAKKDEKTVSDVEADKKTSEARKDENTVSDVEANKKASEAKKDEKTVSDVEQCLLLANKISSIAETKINEEQEKLVGTEKTEILKDKGAISKVKTAETTEPSEKFSKLWNNIVNGYEKANEKNNVAGEKTVEGMKENPEENPDPIDEKCHQNKEKSTTSADPDYKTLGMDNALNAMLFSEQLIEFVLNKLGFAWPCVEGARNLPKECVLVRFTKVIGEAMLDIINSNIDKIAESYRQLMEKKVDTIISFRMEVCTTATFYFAEGYSHYKFLLYAAQLSGLSAFYFASGNKMIAEASAQVLAYIVNHFIYRLVFSPISDWFDLHLEAQKLRREIQNREIVFVMPPNPTPSESSATQKSPCDEVEADSVEVQCTNQP